jgi:hypothetical protein
VWRDLPSVSPSEPARLRGGPDPAQPVRRLALSKTEAAAALGVSVDFFDEHVAPELRIVRRGRRRLVPLREIERWLDANAARAL